MTRSAILAITAAVALSGCMGSTDGGPASASSARGASATLRDAGGATKGMASVRQMGDGIHVEASVTGMAPGTYGIHLHQVGACTAPDFTSAGPHWNPTTKKHGRDNPEGQHNGDLPNIVVGADGTGKVSAHVPGMLEGEGGLLFNEGGSVVVHAAADDYKTDPSGNSGARVACGVLD